MFTKLFLPLFLVTLSLFLFASPAKAFDPNDIVISQDPPFVDPTAGSMKIAIHSNSANFTLNDYGFKAWKDGENTNGGCGPSFLGAKLGSGEGGNLTKLDESNIETSWNFAGCRGRSGIWHFSLWAGKGYNDRNNNSTYVDDYRFRIFTEGGIDPTITIPDPKQIQKGQKLIFELSNAKAGQEYTFWWDGKTNTRSFRAPSDGNFTQELDQESDFKIGDHKSVCLNLGGSFVTGALNWYCLVRSDQVEIVRDPVRVGGCNIAPNVPSTRDRVSMVATHLPPNKLGYRADLEKDGRVNHVGTPQSSNASGFLSLELGVSLDEGNYTATIFDSNDGFVCTKTFFVGTPGPGGIATASGKTCREVQSCSTSNVSPCYPGTGVTGPGGLLTAIGCFPNNPQEIVTSLLRLATLAGGGIALLLMIIGAIRMISSRGNPDSLKAGRDQFVAAFLGLIFVLFTVLFLQIIGTNILQIPGFK